MTSELKTPTNIQCSKCKTNDNLLTDVHGTFCMSCGVHVPMEKKDINITYTSFISIAEAY